MGEYPKQTSESSIKAEMTYREFLVNQKRCTAPVEWLGESR